MPNFITFEVTPVDSEALINAVAFNDALHALNPFRPETAEHCAETSPLVEFKSREIGSSIGEVILTHCYEGVLHGALFPGPDKGALDEHAGDNVIYEGDKLPIRLTQMQAEPPMYRADVSFDRQDTLRFFEVSESFQE